MPRGATQAPLDIFIIEVIRHTDELPQNDAAAIVSKARVSHTESADRRHLPGSMSSCGLTESAVVTADSLAASGQFLLATNKANAQGVH